MKQKLFYFCVLFFALGIHFDALAQHNNSKGKVERLTPEQRIEKQTSQMAHALMLDDAVSAKFVTVYKQYLTEMQTCQRSARMAFGDRAKGAKSQLTDEQIEKQIEARFAQSRKILDIREKYYGEFKKFLKPRQILKIYTVEKSNGAKVKKEIEKRHNKKKAKNNK